MSSQSHKSESIANGLGAHRFYTHLFLFSLRLGVVGSSGWNSLDFSNDGNYTEDHTPRPLQRASDRATAQCADERTRKINSFLYLSPCTIILVRILPSSAARSYTSLPRMCCTITKCAITLARCVDCSSSLTERDKKMGGFIF